MPPITSRHSFRLSATHSDDGYARCNSKPRFELCSTQTQTESSKVRPSLCHALSSSGPQRKSAARNEPVSGRSCGVGLDGEPARMVYQMTGT